MSDLPISAELPEPLDQCPHYLRAVTQLGDGREVVARADIAALDGTKLLARGASVDSSKFEVLSQHKLAMLLDVVLTAANAVDAKQLAFDANKLIASDPFLAMLTGRSGDPLGFRQSLGALTLPAAVAFRLTVMREAAPDLFQHALRVCLITYALAMRMGLKGRMSDLLLAALCHDIGELHTDPDLLAPGRRVTAEERHQFIHLHPVTGHAMLCHALGVPGAVLKAVLQHHERMDGSGYPQGLRGDEIHPFARVLGVPEVTDVLARRADSQRVDVLLRLNHQRFDARVIDALRELLRAVPARTQSDAAAALDTSSQLGQLADMLVAGLELLERLEAQGEPGVDLRFITERISMLRGLMHNSGISSEYVAALTDIAREDHEVANELAATVDELNWLMEDIANEIERRTVSLGGASAEIVGELVALLRGHNSADPVERASAGAADAADPSVAEAAPAAT
ncbi:MAG: HD domain-containing protein [Thauera sp.]|nr:HD domain-containing protein [Thauera sp.]